ncbi:hypothetical protein [Blastomonas fulva]|uniref:Uncharacterized protein n=1 Tax=Blastomonas fulva TaxID=1550728 RepID=A0ABN5B9P0_9SPHN|nr:hypothetical protein [Blastomonas fulva]ASR52450.1 hypothetical protein B5J99_14100 [Blastomonas fulva]
MTGAINEVILRVLERAPQWVRQDLLSSDPIGRARAEETLAAMMSSALADSQATHGSDDADCSES